MKKTYTKPEILFESFTLSTNIANTCDEENSLPTRGVCGLDWGGEIIFMIEVSGCLEGITTEDGYAGLCYHNPTDTTNLFNS